MTKSSKGNDKTKITRISASDTGKKESSVKAVKVKSAAMPATQKPIQDEKKVAKKERAPRKHRNPLAAIGGYFKGSWYELRQVRWPDRRATWSMTGALLIFTIAFLIVILLLDYGFAQLFKLIMGTN